MRAISIFAISLMFCIPSLGQENQFISFIPALKITDIRLADENGNTTIEANESCNLQFTLKNEGKMPGRSVRLRLTLLSPNDLEIKYRKTRSISLVKPGSEHEVRFPINAGETIRDSTAQFMIEVNELDGFDAYPVQFDIPTAQGNLAIPTNDDPALVETDEFLDTTRMKLVGLQFIDNNRNGFLEAYETSYLKYRLYNMMKEDHIRNIILKIESHNGNPDGINYKRIHELDDLTPLQWVDDSIVIKGRKNIEDGLAGFTISLTEEASIESNFSHLEIPTRSYEPPALKITQAQFSGPEGEELELNKPINLILSLTNYSTGSAFDIEVTPRTTNENIKLTMDNPTIEIEEIPGGESKELHLQLIANRRYMFPNFPVMLEITENFNDLFLDTMVVGSFHIPEMIADQKTTAEISPEEESDLEPEKEIDHADVSESEVVSETEEVRIIPPNLVLHNYKFVDQDNNQVINYRESCSIKVMLSNRGSGSAEGVQVKVTQLNPAVTGITYPETIDLGELGPEQEAEIEIPIRGSGNLPNDFAEFRIEVLEARGFDAYPLPIKIQTQKLLEPYLTISKAQFSGKTGDPRRNEDIYLDLTVTNNGPGDASDISVLFELPDNNYCILTGEGLEEFSHKKLQSGESADFQISFLANLRYTEDQIPIQVGISESYRKYGLDTTLVADMLPIDAVVTTFEVKPRIKEEESLASQPNEIESEASDPEPKLRGGGDPIKGLGLEEAIKELEIGRYFALIIGIDEYSGQWVPLDNAVRDAKTVKELLESKYRFYNIRTLYNDLANRANIYDEIEWLVDNVQPEDNVLIYYSGHGEFREDLNKGYWVPYGASTRSTADYIANTEIQGLLRSVNSKHTLLISDACFSGDIFKERGERFTIPIEKGARYYKEIHNKTSRKAITSGGMERVLDSGIDGHSIFTYYLLQSLQNNQERFFDASQLFNDIKTPVVYNSNQIPKYQPIQNMGDTGGQFIFIRK
jgi:hypothetical protein